MNIIFLPLYLFPDSFTYTPPSHPYGGRQPTPAPTTSTTTTAPRPEMGYLEVRIDLQRSRFPLNEQVCYLL